jgi:hypothetical protein
MSEGRPNEYKWYNDPQAAHLVAITIIRNKDAQSVAVENLATKTVEKLYHI